VGGDDEAVALAQRPGHVRALSRAFYEALGWTCDTDPALDVAFFQLGGIALAVRDRKQLAEDSTVSDRGGASAA
jgi:hypothetical protein